MMEKLVDVEPGLIRSECPGCGSKRLSAPWVIRQQPVILNYRFPSPEVARSMPRTDIHLVECEECGLIFNGSFDESRVPYDDRYDNRQGFSQAFQDHLAAVAGTLSESFGISGCTVFEVGCGKGDFLKHFCELSDCDGIGYDTTCEEDPDSSGRVSFHRRYAGPEDVDRELGLVLCRHVIEHVPEIGSFLRLLYEIASKGRARVTYLETPLWDWIEENGAFWDIFHEHCNYFRGSTLRLLAEQAGFEVLRHDEVFGGQYQALYLGCDQGDSSGSLVAVRERTSFDDRMSDLAGEEEMLSRRVAEMAGSGKWGIWGAGAKGVTLANRIDPAPEFVVDVNPGKQGHFVPGTSIPIVSPDSEEVAAARLVLAANPNYLEEIEASLRQSSPSSALIAC